MRIEDILEAIANIQSYVKGMDLKQFKVDRRTVDAVVRNITVVGEAARYIPDEIVSRYPDVPWLEMRDIRNLSMNTSVSALISYGKQLSVTFLHLSGSCNKSSKQKNNNAGIMQ